MYKDKYEMYSEKVGYPYLKRQSSVIDEEIISLPNALELIKKAVNDEVQDELFYTKLIEKAPSEDVKEIIIKIRDDEKKHNEILKFIYSNITGEVIQNEQSSSNNDNNEATYIDDIVNALFSELDAIKKYRKIMGAMPNPNTRTLIMSILTDEIRHANLYNYLISKNNSLESNG